jgi:hypothetical protein
VLCYVGIHPGAERYSHSTKHKGKGEDEYGAFVDWLGGEGEASGKTAYGHEARDISQRHPKGKSVSFEEGHEGCCHEARTAGD